MSSFEEYQRRQYRKYQTRRRGWINRLFRLIAREARR